MEEEGQVCKMIFAITAKCLQLGNLPTDGDELMRLFRHVPASRESIQRLAKENKLYWLRDINMGQTPTEYNRAMNDALFYYLSKKI